LRIGGGKVMALRFLWDFDWLLAAGDWLPANGLIAFPEFR